MQHNLEQYESNLCHERWYSMLQQIKFENQFSEFLTLCKYSFGILACNANVEHVFSLMNVQWTKELNSFDVTTVKLYCNANITARSFISKLCKTK